MIQTKWEAVVMKIDKLLSRMDYLIEECGKLFSMNGFTRLPLNMRSSSHMLAFIILSMLFTILPFSMVGCRDSVNKGYEIKCYENGEIIYESKWVKNIERREGRFVFKTLDGKSSGTNSECVWSEL